MQFLGVLDRGERGDGNGTGLKEEGGIEMSTTVLPLRDARSLRFVFKLLVPGPVHICLGSFCLQHKFS